MQLNRQTDFALRTMIYLAAVPVGERVQIKQVCDAFDISSNHVSKIVNKLANAGFIDSQRGRAGGICLGRPAEDINLGDLVREIEPTLFPVNCYEPECALLPSCRVKSVLAAASRAFIECIASYTLADVSDKQLDIVQLPD